ncbi:MAG: SiaC family regulatory phosphoprotein [Bacteroidetes bacterium]|nr:SiaC family regulatory phosphoprotein [Bacteroidota bacterium]
MKENSKCTFNTNVKTAYIKGTNVTPRVLLDAKRNIIDIKGKAISTSDNTLFGDIRKWIDHNSSDFSKSVNVNVAFDYFNTHCSKEILDLFKMLEGYHKRGSNINVNWLHEEEDEDMLEAGEDYQAIIDIPFKMVQHNNPLEMDDTYYEENAEDPKEHKTLIIDINQEILKYLAKHPEYLHDLTPRKFEELVADILKDFGFDVELTKISRDGGRDIIARIRNSLTNILMFVECKHYAPDRPVGVDIIRQVVGVNEIFKPNKSLIVTSSYFTKDAIKERNLIETKLDLKDHLDIKNWLERYK